MLSVGPDGPTDLRVDVWPTSRLYPCRRHRLSRTGFWQLEQPFPEDLVVEVGWNAVFSREVEAAGFLRPVSRVMSRLQVGTGGEFDLLWVQAQCCRLQKRRSDGIESPRARRLDVEDICHRPRIISVQVEVLRAQDVLDRAEQVGLTVAGAHDCALLHVGANEVGRGAMRIDVV